MPCQERGTEITVRGLLRKYQVVWEIKAITMETQGGIIVKGLTMVEIWVHLGQWDCETLDPWGRSLVPSSRNQLLLS